MLTEASYVFIGGVVSAILTAIINRKRDAAKSKADLTQIIANAGARLAKSQIDTIEHMVVRMDAMDQKIEECERDRMNLRQGFYILITAVEANGDVERKRAAVSQAREVLREVDK